MDPNARIVSEDALLGQIDEAANRMRTRGDELLQRAVADLDDRSKLQFYQDYTSQSNRVVSWMKEDLSRAANVFGYDAIDALDGQNLPEFRVINRSRLVVEDSNRVEK